MWFILSASYWVLYDTSLLSRRFIFSEFIFSLIEIWYFNIFPFCITSFLLQILISNDVNLCNKAEVHGINAYSKDELGNVIQKMKHDSSNGYQSSKLGKHQTLHSIYFFVYVNFNILLQCCYIVFK